MSVRCVRNKEKFGLTFAVDNHIIDNSPFRITEKGVLSMAIRNSIEIVGKHAVEKVKRASTLNAGLAQM